MSVLLDPTSVRISEDAGEVVITVLKQGQSEISTSVNVDTMNATALGECNLRHTLDA